MPQTAFSEVANNAQSTLAADITNVATSITVATGHGTRFGTITNGMYATIWNSAAGYADPFSDPNMEVVRITARSTDTLTVTRAQRGTSGVAHSTGHDIRALVDSQLLTDIHTAVNNAEWNNKVSRKFCDFDGGNLDTYFNTNATGASVAFSTGTAARPGMYSITSTLTTGYFGVMYTAFGALLAGGGTLTVEWDFNIANLSDGTNTYGLRMGFGDTSTAADITDGAYLEYASGTSANWIMCTAAGATRTKTASSTAVATGWHKGKVVINAAGTSVEYFIDGTSIGTVTTNIPTAGGQEFGRFFQFTSGVNTGTSRTFLLDRYADENALTTAR